MRTSSVKIMREICEICGQSQYMAEHSGFQKLVAEAKKHITEISPQDAAAKLSSGDAVVVDVRDKDEWDEGHIPGATHMSRGTIELDIEEKVPDPNAMIICHCGGGGRSALAAETLQKMGYKNVHSMAGGLKAWKAAWPGKRPVCRRRHSHHSGERGRLAHSVARLAQHTFASGRYVTTSLGLMSLRLCFFACALLNVAQITAVFAADLKDNPLAAESVLPYQYPPFDKIKDEHFVPAIEAGMREQLKEIEPIANNSEKPTFDNTIVALERTGRLLDRAQRTFSNLNACDTNPTRQKIDKEMAPKLAAHHDEIFLNPKLFARVQALYEKRDELGLDPESAYLLERYYKDFVRAGAKLSDSDKEKLKKINAELAKLQTEFEQNVLKERNASSVRRR